jgi:hypothetical protein
MGEVFLRCATEPHRQCTRGWSLAILLRQFLLLLSSSYDVFFGLEYCVAKLGDACVCRRIRVKIPPVFVSSESNISFCAVHVDHLQDVGQVLYSLIEELGVFMVVK